MPPADRRVSSSQVPRILVAPDSQTPRILVAPDKFKGTLTGAAAAAAMTAGVLSVAPGAHVEQFTLADGGEGTVETVLATGATRHTCTVPGPLGDPVEATFALLGDTAVLESAQACGLQLLAGVTARGGPVPRRVAESSGDSATRASTPGPETALRASSAGLGTLVGQAWATGATRIIVGLGGVATTDGGVGLASSLGVRFVDARGIAVAPGELEQVAAIDLRGLDPRVHETTFVAATDVTNPLLGPTGAAAVYAPQKGAGPHEVELLERGLRTVAERVEAATHHHSTLRARGSTLRARDSTLRARDSTLRARDLPGAGAAGGLGWGLVTFLGASIRSGGELVMDLIGVPAALDRADLVLTGEGTLDAQSRFGKGPVALAQLAAACGVPTIAVAGAVDAVPDTHHHEAGFAAVWSLVDELGADAALHDAASSLTEVTARAVRDWLARA
ncbi:glycerate kinase [Ornithinimicrobium ciconiae]|uniref:glycerate kinase n=1 Tax=Ornithinimicrobium ciconiae TaxID=2594265 RepID=UPI00192DB749|nr:glycerate kinase [Ornithinimicrobium ciconiae]